jgi:hypothetical protein
VKLIKLAEKEHAKLPTDLDQKHTDLIDKLSKSRGADYDKKNMEAMIKPTKNNRRIRIRNQEPPPSSFGPKRVAQTENAFRHDQKTSTEVAALHRSGDHRHFPQLIVSSNWLLEKNDAPERA